MVSNKVVSNKEWKKAFLDRLENFSVRIIRLANKLPKTAAGFVIASQLIKAGTSIGANTGEAQDASSYKDFINKLNIALREAKETRYWLKIIHLSGLLTFEDVTSDLDECEEIIAILTSSLKSAKAKFK